MSSAFAHSPWTVPARSASPPMWRFARELPPGHDGRAAVALQWWLPRQQSFVPGRLGKVFLALCVVSLGIGTAFWMVGAPAVLPLAGAELLLLGAAFWACTRHAADAEKITLAERMLEVEHRCGRSVERVAYRAEWVRVEPALDDDSLVELTGQGRRMRVGRYLRPELRPALARELRHALNRACLGPAARDTDLEPQR